MPYGSPYPAGFAFRVASICRARARPVEPVPIAITGAMEVTRMTILRRLDWQVPGMPAARRHRAAIMSRIEQSSGNMRFGFAASLTIWAVTLALLFG